MSDLILPKEAQKKPEWKSILSFDVDETGRSRVQVMTSNEAHLALALRKIGMAVDEYLANQELKHIQEANKIVQATVPPNILNKIRGN